MAKGKIKKFVKKVANKLSAPMQRQAQAKARKELDDIGRAFNGGVDEYVQRYPDYAPRAKELKKKAGY